MKRQIEVFSAGCPLCDETAQKVKQMACPSCEVKILDMRTLDASTRARQLGVQSLPAVAVNGVLAGCCTGRGVNEATLRATGIGCAL